MCMFHIYVHMTHESYFCLSAVIWVHHSCVIIGYIYNNFSWDLHYTPSSRSTVKLRLWVLAQDWQLILHVLLLHILVLPSLVSKFVEQRWRFHYWKEPHWSLHILAIRLTNIVLHKQREDRKGVQCAKGCDFCGIQISCQEAVTGGQWWEARVGEYVRYIAHICVVCEGSKY